MESTAYPVLVLFCLACFLLIGFSYSLAKTKNKLLNYTFVVVVGVVFSYLLLDKCYSLSLKHVKKVETWDRIYIYEEMQKKIKDNDLAKLKEMIDDLTIMDKSLLNGDPAMSEYQNIKTKWKK